MKYLNTYKLFESIETYQDLFEVYKDCFIDLVDMNIFIGVETSTTRRLRLPDQLKDINDEIENTDNLIEANPSISYTKGGDKVITIEIVGRGYQNSSEHLTKVYNDYIVTQLEEDEYQFEKVSGYKIHNGLTKISIKEWDVNPTTERWKELVNDKNIQGYSSDRFGSGSGVQYNRDSDGRGYAWYTYVVNSARLKKLNSLLDDRSFIQRLFSRKKKGYNFPKLTDKMEVENFHIIHYISK